MQLPTFLIIGASSAGTDVLYHYLRLHPQVYVSPLRDCDFFALEGHRMLYYPGSDLPRGKLESWEQYCSLFSRAGWADAVGEMSSSYLYVDHCAERIKARLPNVRLIAVLRNPVERAQAHFRRRRRRRDEPASSFGRALRIEEMQRAAGCSLLESYVGMGFYSAQLARYLEVFEPHQTRVYFYEDLADDPVGALRDLCRFLGVEYLRIEDEAVAQAVPIPAPRRRRRGPVSRFALANEDRLAAIDRWSGRPSLRETDLWARRRHVRPDIHHLLESVYSADIERLEKLLGRDLSIWVQKPLCARA